MLSASTFHSPTTKPGSARPEIKYMRFKFFLFLIRAINSSKTPKTRRRERCAVVCTAPLARRAGDAPTSSGPSSRVTRSGRPHTDRPRRGQPPDRPELAVILPCTPLPPSRISPAPPGLVMLPAAAHGSNNQSHTTNRTHKRTVADSATTRTSGTQLVIPRPANHQVCVTCWPPDALTASQAFCLPPPLFANGRQARAITTTACMKTSRCHSKLSVATPQVVYQCICMCM